MISKDEQIRSAIAEQAAEWFVSNDETPLDQQQSAALIAWLKTSPLHVEEFLRVAVIARDLHALSAETEHTLATLLARARAEDDRVIVPFWPRALAAARDFPAHRWPAAGFAMAALVAVTFALMLWSPRPRAPALPPVAVTALHFATRHGEEQTRRLADNSILHLDTDTAVTVRYSNTERLVTLASGQAAFEVAHEPKRPFRVIAGAADITDLGTKFDVRLKEDATVVTVVEGRVAVAASPTPMGGGAESSRLGPLRTVELGADQQITVSKGEWPVTPVNVDAQRATSWLHRQISFEREPLERVATEFNRYAPKPIEIATPALRAMEISGVFSTDDSDAFVAFLRSLDGVRVDVTATRILVSQK